MRRVCKNFLRTLPCEQLQMGCFRHDRVVSDVISANRTNKICHMRKLLGMIPNLDASFPSLFNRIHRTLPRDNVEAVMNVSFCVPLDHLTSLYSRKLLV